MDLEKVRELSGITYHFVENDQSEFKGITKKEMEQIMRNGQAFDIACNVNYN